MVVVIGEVMVVIGEVLVVDVIPDEVLLDDMIDVLLDICSRYINGFMSLEQAA